MTNDDNSTNGSDGYEAGRPTGAASDAIAYQFNKSQVRTIQVGDTVWFAAPDVCKILKLVNVSRALSRLVDEEKSFANLFSSGQIRETAMINESGLIALILRSRKRDAIIFRRWITNEVLPSIWKTGSYTAGRNGAAQEHSDIADIIDRRPGIYIVIVNKNERRVQHTNGGEVVTLVTEAMSGIMAGALITAQGALKIMQSKTLVLGPDEQLASEGLAAAVSQGATMAKRYVAMSHYRSADAEIPPVGLPN